MLFFIHGIGGDLDAWSFARDILLEKGFPALAMDIRGHGYSSHSRSAKSYQIENVVQDVLSILEQEKAHNVILIGHCYGAAGAATFAIQHGEKLQALVMISGTYRPPSYLNAKMLRAISNRLIGLAAFLGLKPIHPQHSSYPTGKFHKDYEWLGLAKTIVHNSLGNYLLTAKEIVNLNIETKLSRISIPTLIIVGGKDSIFPPPISQKMHAKISGSTFTLVEGANHVVILNNADQVADALYDFLKKITKR